MTVIDPERKKYTFEKLGYKPHSEQQQEIHDSQARFRTLSCGRRWGKTTFGGNELTAAMVDPYDIGYYWIVGPKYTAAEKEFRVVRNNIQRKLKFGSKVKVVNNVKQGDMTIEMPWGTLLECKSAMHKDTLLGEGLKGVVMAEAARHDSETWEQYVRPALADYRGWAIFTSTPRGYNWFQGLYLLGKMGRKNRDHKSWTLPAWSNPVVYPGGRDDPEIKAIEAEVSKQWFAQEIAALFTAFAGKIYEEFDPTYHVKPIRYRPEWTNVWFLDYGWSNPFVCLDVMIDPEENFYVWREYMVSEMTTYEHAKILNERADDPFEYHVDWAAGDPRGPDQANTISYVTGVQVYSQDIASNAHESWVLGVEHVARLLKIRDDGLPKLFIDPSCTELIRQMDQLHAPDPKPEINAREGQHKYDDHGPDALRYGVGQFKESGAGSSLSDIYAPGKQTQAQTFFQNNSPMTRNARF